MKSRPRISRTLATLAVLGTALLAAGSAGAQVADWPDVFNPLQLHSLNLAMDPGDWITIQNDQTLSIEVPAFFWADGEPQLLVSVRRKSADALNQDPGFLKVSLKVDVNVYITGQKWHQLTKVSLENGDDQDVLSEGFAWQMHRLAHGSQGYGYDAGLANWVVVTINGVNTGVYVHVSYGQMSLMTP